MKLTKTNKAAAKPTTTKPEAKAPAKSAKLLKGRFVAIGSKGCAYVLGGIPEGTDLEKPLSLVWGSFKTAGVSARQLCDAHAKGRAIGGHLSSFDLGCYVGARGGSVRIIPEAQATKAGLKLVKFTLNGKRVVKGYVPQKWTPASKLPSYVATSDVAAGRVETFSCPGGRAENLQGKLEIA